MPAPPWFFRLMYDRESKALERRHDEPLHHELDEKTVDGFAKKVAPPGPVADLGCGPGPHALALARRGYDVVGVDNSPRMVETAKARAARDKTDVTFYVQDLNSPLRFEESSLGGVVAILVIQHLQDPAAFVSDIGRCLRPGGHALIIAPASHGTPSVSRNLYWRLRGAFYQHVPRVVRFYDAISLANLVADQGLAVVECTNTGRTVSVLART